MKVIKSSEKVPFSNSSTCSGYSYGFGDAALDIAIVTVDGRYPERGSLVNEVCKEIGYVLSGTGTVGVGSETRELEPGDAVMIQPGEHFYWQGNGLTMLMPCSPAFDPKQHKEVE